MIPAKANHKNQHKDTICRFCKKEEETQRHLLQECNKIPWTRKYDINYDNAFSDADLKQTREAAQCTQELCSILEENPPPWKAEAERIALDPQGETAGNALGEPPG